jgi:hypothetical protein
MRHPEGMTPEHAERLVWMTPEQRLRVLERAAIIQEATGKPWPECDECALVGEGITVQQRLVGA